MSRPPTVAQYPSARPNKKIEQAQQYLDDPADETVTLRRLAGYRLGLERHNALLALERERQES